VASFPLSSLSWQGITWHPWTSVDRCSLHGESKIRSLIVSLHLYWLFYVISVQTRLSRTHVLWKTREQILVVDMYLFYYSEGCDAQSLALLFWWFKCSIFLTVRISGNIDSWRQGDDRRQGANKRKGNGKQHGDVRWWHNNSWPGALRQADGKVRRHPVNR